MARTRTVDHDAVLDRWAKGMRRPDIAAVLGLSKDTVKTVIRLAREDDDERAAPHRVQGVSAETFCDQNAPLHVQMGIRAETVFVPTLEGGDHWHRIPVTVASLRGGPVVYHESIYRDYVRKGWVRTAVARAVTLYRQAA